MSLWRWKKKSDKRYDLFLISNSLPIVLFVIVLLIPLVAFIRSLFR